MYVAQPVCGFPLFVLPLVHQRAVEKSKFITDCFTSALWIWRQCLSLSWLTLLLLPSLFWPSYQPLSFLPMHGVIRVQQHAFGILEDCSGECLHPPRGCIRKLTQLWYTKLRITTIIKCNVFRSHSHLKCCQYYSRAGGFFCISNCVFEEPDLQSYERTTFIMSPVSTKGGLGVTKHWLHWAGKCWWDGELQALQTPDDTLSCKFNLQKVCSDNPRVGYTMK